MFRPKECYPMKNSHRGSALIFVNVERDGAKTEIEHLIFTVKLMGLVPFVYSDLTSVQADNVLESITNPHNNVDLSNIQPLPPKLNKNDDMIFIAFSTHGSEKFLKFSDGKLLEYSYIKSFFNVDICPVLIGKPKIILFNSCRCNGEIFDTSYHTRKTPHTRIMTDCLNKNTTDYVVHTTNSDIIVIYSTNLATVSIRLDDRGSLAIEQIKAAFEKYSGTDLSFESILSRANRELIMITDRDANKHMDQMNIHRIGQCMEWVSTLKYDLIIPPFNSPIAVAIDNYHKGFTIDLTVDDTGTSMDSLPAPRNQPNNKILNQEDAASSDMVGYSAPSGLNTFYSNINSQTRISDRSSFSFTEIPNFSMQKHSETYPQLYTQDQDIQNFVPKKENKTKNQSHEKTNMDFS